jgi:hypothetical protein
VVHDLEPLIRMSLPSQVSPGQAGAWDEVQVKGENGGVRKGTSKEACGSR